MRMITVLAVFGLAWSAPATAQDPAPLAEPGDVVREYFEAMRVGDWEAVAALMHPDAMRDFKEMFVPIVGMDPSNEVATALFGVADLAEFEAADPNRMFAAAMRTMLGTNASLVEALEGGSVETIGHVEEEGTDVVYVLYRMKITMQGMTIEQLDVMPVALHEGRWRGLLTGEMKGLAAALTQQTVR